MFEFFNSWMRWIALYATQNPGQFLFTILVILSPFFIISAYLSWKLAKHIETEDKKKKIKAKRVENIKARKKIH